MGFFALLENNSSKIFKYLFKKLKKSLLPIEDQINFSLKKNQSQDPNKKY
jgi:hypothetical protein